MIFGLPIFFFELHLDFERRWASFSQMFHVPPELLLSHIVEFP